MEKILFWDVSKLCYSFTSLNGGANGLGGTEVSLLRVAKGLSERYSVDILQEARLSSEVEAGVRFIGLSDISSTELYDRIILLRDPRKVFECEGFFPKNKTFIWLHDLWKDLSESQKLDFNLLFGEWKNRFVCVSMWHKHHILSQLSSAASSVLARLNYHKLSDREVFGDDNIVVQYNPVFTDYDFLSSPKDVNFNQLIYASSPGKGLEQTIKVFCELKKRKPDLILKVANPGYANLPDIGHIPGVYVIGERSHQNLLEDMRESLCLFSMQTVAETFGIVFAEANSVGTPVLTTSLGAAPEVIGDHRQLLSSAVDIETIYDRIDSWQSGGRPDVNSSVKFSIDYVVESWATLLNDN